MRSFDLPGVRCTFHQEHTADQPVQDRRSIHGTPLVNSVHHLSDALLAEQAEITHFQEATHHLECHVHDLLDACEKYLSTCQSIDTTNLTREVERLLNTGSCPYVTCVKSASPMAKRKVASI